MRKPHNWQQDLTLPFFVYLVGLVVSVFGDITFMLAVMWLILEKTGSATAVALGGALGALPILILGAPAGVMVDRTDRRLLLIGSDLIRLSAVLTFTLLMDRLGIYALYALLFTENAASTVFMPARGAMMPTLVPHTAIPTANAVLGFTRQLVQIAAWGLGGLLLTLIGFRGIALLDVATFSVSLLSLFALLRLAAPQRLIQKGQNYWASIVEGVRYVWSTRWLRSLLTIYAAASLATAPLNTLTPIFVERLLGGDVNAYGVVQAVLLVGIMVGSIVGGVLARVGLGRLLLLAMAGMGVGFILAALSHAVWAGAITYGFIGISLAMVNMSTYSLLQRHVPSEKQGRSFSLLTTVAAAATPLTLVLSGPVTDRFGIQVIYWAGGALVVAVGLGALRTGSLAAVDTNRHEERPVSAAG